MTDQKQAPERIWFFNDDVAGWIGLSKPHLDQDGMEPVPYIRKDLHDAAIKHRDELAAEVSGLKDAYTGAMEDKRIWKRRAQKAEAERDQVLAASAAREIAMRDRAADHAWNKRDLLADAEKKQVEVGLSGRDYYGRRLESELLSRSIRALPLSPDGQQALNEMLADVWDEGYDIGVVDGSNEHEYCVDHNPYRKGAT